MDGRIVRRVRRPLHGRPRIMIPSFATFLRSSFAFFGLVAGLWFGSTACAAAPSHAHRYPDAVVAKVWTPTGERWVRLEQGAPGFYHGSVEFASDGWMAVTEYYNFTCLLTLDDPTAPLKFHHEFRSADGFAPAPSEFWATLTFNWATGAFEQTEDFAAVFNDPAVVVQPQASQVSAASPSSPQAAPSRSIQARLPPPAGSPSASAPRQPSALKQNFNARLPAPAYDVYGFDAYGFDRSGYDRDGYDANGYDRRGVDRQGFNRDGVYQGDFDAEGYDITGYDRDGYDREGYDHNGRDREGYDYEGFNTAGYNRYGGYLLGYDQSYIAPNADGASAFDDRGFDSSGRHRNGSLFDDEGYDAQGFDGNARNRGGFDPDGFDEFGFDQFGYDFNGFDASGFSREGRDASGFDRNGRNLRGFNRDGLYLDGSLYDARGFDQYGYDRRGRYDYGVPYDDASTQPTEAADIPSSGGLSSGPQAMVDGLKDLLRDEGFVADLVEDDAFVVAQMQRQAAGLPDMTPDEYAALAQRYLEDSLFNLWMDLELRIQAWEAGFGLDDEPIEVLRAKQAQIEDYLLAQASPGAPRPVKGSDDVAAAPKPSQTSSSEKATQPDPPHDTAGTAALAFAEALVVGAVVGAVAVTALPAVIAVGTAAVAAAGLSAATITAFGGAIEGGLLAYAAYDTGKTAVDVKADLAAGRLDAAASKVGGMTGTIIGGVGASKVLGKGVTRDAGEVVGESAEAKASGKVVGKTERPVEEFFIGTKGVSEWSGPIESYVVKENMIMYRVYGGESARFGAWLTPVKPDSADSARALLSLPSTNTAVYVSEVVVPAGIRIQVGKAAPAFGQPGGGQQVKLLEGISESCFQPGVPLK